MNALNLIGRGANLLTAKRILVATAAAAGLYTVGDDGLSYLKTASRIVSSNVVDQIPVEFELERAKTMVADLQPDIRHNLLVIAQEEVQVQNIRNEIAKTKESIEHQREGLEELKQAFKSGSDEVRVGKRMATASEIEAELTRRFTNYRLAEATLASKLELLSNRETALEAAQLKLKRMLEARRDLTAQVDNLEARLRTVQSQAVTQRVDFDESHVAKCENLIDSLRARMQVSEKLLVQDGEQSTSAFDFDVAPSNITREIERYLGTPPPSDVTSSN